MFGGLLPESHGQNLALTVLHVPYSLDSGISVAVNLDDVCYNTKGA